MKKESTQRIGNESERIIAESAHSHLPRGVDLNQERSWRRGRKLSRSRAAAQLISETQTEACDRHRARSTKLWRPPPPSPPPPSGASRPLLSQSQHDLLPTLANSQREWLTKPIAISAGKQGPLHSPRTRKSTLPTLPASVSLHLFLFHNLMTSPPVIYYPLREQVKAIDGNSWI